MISSELFENTLLKVFSSKDTLKHITLKVEQNESIYHLINGGDLLAVLPTGFGKSLIFEVLLLVKEVLSKKDACVVVVCPLESIVSDQIEEASSMGLIARSIKDMSSKEIEVDTICCLGQLRKY